MLKIEEQLFAKILLMIVVLAAFTIGAEDAHARRVALVIGNSNYQHSSKLDNTVSDAEAMSSVLASSPLNFEVIKAFDTNRRDLIKNLREFSKMAEEAEIAIFFYSGHGIQVNGRNFIVPIDADLKDVDPNFDLIDNVVEMTRVLQSGANARTALFFLDACRDNPFIGQIFGNSKSVGKPKGFTFEDPAVRELSTPDARQTFIGFATAANNTATTGTGRLSPYTSALVKHLPTADTEFSEVYANVTLAVKDATANKQVPTRRSNLGLLKLVNTGGPGKGANLLKPEPGIGSGENRLCERARDLSLGANSPAFCNRAMGQWKIYLDVYPDGLCAGEAKLQLAQLEQNTACRGNSGELAQPKPAVDVPSSAEVTFCENARNLTKQASDCKSYRLAKTEWQSYAASYPEGLCSREVSPRMNYLDTQIETECGQVVSPQRPTEHGGSTLLASGTYAGVRGYTDYGRPKANSECLQEYHFEAEVANNELTFWSEGRIFTGSIDERGRIRITNLGVSPPTKSRFSVTGFLDDAKMYSDYCGSGYFRLMR